MCNNPRHDVSIHFPGSPLSACFIPIAEGLNVFIVLEHSNCPPDRSHCIGYTEGNNGSVDGQCELFRVLDPWPVAIGDHGTVLNLSPRACRRPYPTRCSVRISADGYRCVPTAIDAPTQIISRLMGLAWLPRMDGDTEVDHIDGNKSHDVLDNLRWVDHSDNMRNATYSPHRRWDPADRVLCLPIRGQGNPVWVHPMDVASIVQSSNVSHVLTRKTRRSCNGWALLLNPTITDITPIVITLRRATTLAVCWRAGAIGQPNRCAITSWQPSKVRLSGHGRAVSGWVTVWCVLVGPSRLVMIPILWRPWLEC